MALSTRDTDTALKTTTPQTIQTISVFSDVCVGMVIWTWDCIDTANNYTTILLTSGVCVGLAISTPACIKTFFTIKHNLYRPY